MWVMFAAEGSVRVINCDHIIEFGIELVMPELRVVARTTNAPSEIGNEKVVIHRRNVSGMVESEYRAAVSDVSKVLTAITDDLALGVMVHDVSRARTEREQHT